MPVCLDSLDKLIASLFSLRKFQSVKHLCIFLAIKQSLKMAVKSITSKLHVQGVPELVVQFSFPCQSVKTAKIFTFDDIFQVCRTLNKIYLEDPLPRPLKYLSHDITIVGVEKIQKVHHRLGFCQNPHPNLQTDRFSLSPET